ncbi:hypothetical protein [Thiohalobacter thiocyanaticus]|uniref:Uncharacterized protein n=1 Tax=Thiohalobacter thiocyanaticus TaxID=585455 RepID=A0A426QM96_9GAMM|nr:hypothetical protein [Thiohalobacter thiocyanaticus]RRQ22892.1 hypothetical protein D6C00_13780 [Thiohalobacter thiocyanaticus]
MKNRIENNMRNLLMVVMFGGMLVSTASMGATLTFENGEIDARFVSDNLDPYQPNPFDQPADGADALTQATASEWVGINPMGAAAADLYWDGGLDGGSNSLANLLLADTFSLAQFHVAGVYGSQTLTVQGYNNGNLLYQDSLFIDLTPQVFNAGWSGIDQLRFLAGADYSLDPAHADAGGNRYWAIDNLVFDESISEVPLPAAVWLFLSGLVPLLGVGAVHRR